MSNICVMVNCGKWSERCKQRGSDLLIERVEVETVTIVMHKGGPECVGLGIERQVEAKALHQFGD